MSDEELLETKALLAQAKGLLETAVEAWEANGKKTVMAGSWHWAELCVTVEWMERAESLVDSVDAI